ncbi:hypothetical protein Sango_0492000 [Sesamum angolense]|uniref:Uncharacterized protein n=1 Tax=Sesamum angolense TaxID=2727404 RepID=A0AAE1XC61_9LAMI|nr:hypothetical protein Sango_0492000 [Sesamum angolense]
MCSDTSTPEDFVSGLMKITPNVYSDADYWLLTDTDVNYHNLCLEIVLLLTVLAPFLKLSKPLLQVYEVNVPPNSI